MKEINGQLYGYSYELDATSEDDGTTCFAVDTGTIFFAYSGIWYEQKNAFWQAGGGSSGGGSSLPEVSASDNGDVLTVVEGEWDKAAPSGGGPLVVNITYDESTNTYTCDKTAAEIWAARLSVVMYEAESDTDGQYSMVTSIGSDGVGVSFSCGDASASLFFTAESMSDYPSGSLL